MRPPARPRNRSPTVCKAACTHAHRQTQICSYLSLVSGGSDAGEVDGLVFSGVQLHHQGVSVDHLHHLEGQKKRTETVEQRLLEDEAKFVLTNE